MEGECEPHLSISTPDSCQLQRNANSRPIRLFPLFTTITLLVLQWNPDFSNLQGKRSRNREFEKSKVASNYAKLAVYCLIMSKCSKFNKNTSFLM